MAKTTNITITNLTINVTCTGAAERKYPSVLDQFLVHLAQHDLPDTQVPTPAVAPDTQVPTPTPAVAPDTQVPTPTPDTPTPDTPTPDTPTPDTQVPTGTYMQDHGIYDGYELSPGDINALDGGDSVHYVRADGTGFSGVVVSTEGDFDDGDLVIRIRKDNGKVTKISDIGVDMKGKFFYA